MTKPLVSVLLPVFNEEILVGRAIESILAQTLTSLELIVINDGSTDQTESIIRRYTDSRVVSMNQANKGIVAALNRGIASARSELIARIDADDVSTPTRLAEEVEFLDCHPNYGIVGSLCTTQYEDRSRPGMKVEVPLSDSAIRQRLPWGNPFIHSSVVMRRSVLDRIGLYDPRFRCCEDYELWCRILSVSKGRNLDGALVTRTDRAESLSKVARSQHYFENMRVQLSCARQPVWGKRFYVGALRSALRVVLCKPYEAIWQRGN